MGERGQRATMHEAKDDNGSGQGEQWVLQRGTTDQTKGDNGSDQVGQRVCDSGSGWWEVYRAVMVCPHFFACSRVACILG
jgi:hypothetical protein